MLIIDMKLFLLQEYSTSSTRSSFEEQMAKMKKMMKSPLSKRKHEGKCLCEKKALEFACKCHWQLAIFWAKSTSSKSSTHCLNNTTRFKVSSKGLSSQHTP
jgi:hypothetical protein